MTAGCEVGLHGIDAWLDSSKGREELEEIRRLTGASEIGVRMHWLYYDQQSPVALEKAGAAYDSTIGYNETVGYRAGTTQAYKPLEATRLLELPLHVMDTALFYPRLSRAIPTRGEDDPRPEWWTMRSSLEAASRSTGTIAASLRRGCGAHVIVTWFRI